MRTVSLVIKTASGGFIDPTTGTPLGCVADGNDIARVVDLYRAIVASEGKITIGRKEIKASEIRLLANHTAGGELKAKKSFRI
jgi:hypothetical protein